jgi:Lar family restriction alleviation protein
MDTIDEAYRWLDKVEKIAWDGLIPIGLVRELLQELDKGEQIRIDPKRSTTHERPEPMSNAPKRRYGNGNQAGTTGQEEPKPCPFCGHDASVEYNEDTSHLWSVVCESCGAEGPQAWRRRECIELWNRRIPEPGTLDELSDVERQECGYPATREELVSALKGAELTMSNARIFVMSRQRIKRPEGEDLYNETLGHIRDILSREENHGKH